MVKANNNHNGHGNGELAATVDEQSLVKEMNDLKDKLESGDQSAFEDIFFHEDQIGERNSMGVLQTLIHAWVRKEYGYLQVFQTADFADQKEARLIAIGYEWSKHHHSKYGMDLMIGITTAECGVDANRSKLAAGAVNPWKGGTIDYGSRQSHGKSGLPNLR